MDKELSGLPVQVSSAGTHALVGKPMHGTMQEIGLPGSDRHEARQLTSEMLRETDLILAMDREHRREIVEKLPRVSRRTFTFREFARLADEVSSDFLTLRSRRSRVEILRNAVESVAQIRGSLPLLEDPSQEDVVDPFGREHEVFDLSIQQITPAVSSCVRLFKDALGEV